MVDILIRNVDEEVVRRMKRMAAAERTSLNEIARRALAADVMPGNAEAKTARLRRKERQRDGASTKDDPGRSR